MQEKERKMLNDYTFRIYFLLVVFKRHRGSERVDETLLYCTALNVIMGGASKSSAWNLLLRCEACLKGRGQELVSKHGA